MHPSIFTLKPDEMERLLARRRRADRALDPISMPDLLTSILRIANQFVPSESGSVFIDDPAVKLQHPHVPSLNELVFVACFGDKADVLVGRRLAATDGIVGKTYSSGRAYIAKDAPRDPNFDSSVDAETAYRTRSILCVPIRIERSVVGVLELINRLGGSDYDDNELQLLQIFADYISLSLQNFLDGARFRELSKRDDLTGLYNDRYFHERLSEELSRVQDGALDLGLVFLDLDRFKEINDVHGHLVGSRTLREVGTLLLSACPSIGTVARYGGDEFVVILPEHDLEQTRVVAEDMRARIAGSSFIVDESVQGPRVTIAGIITASVGVASLRGAALSLEMSPWVQKNELLRLADRAMYDAKDAGKNQVCVRTSLASSAAARATLPRV